MFYLYGTAWLNTGTDIKELTDLFEGAAPQILVTLILVCVV